MNKQQLASKIWQSANKMRSKIEANEYKDYILGFIFYKFLSDKELKLLKEEGMSAEEIKALTEEDEDAVNFIQSKVGYFIAYKDLFSAWLEKGSDFEVGNVREALSAFNRHISIAHKKVFNGIFDTLQTGLSKLGDTAASQSKAVSDLLQLIKDIPMDGKQDYDVLGFIYEYLISNFAANAGKKAGEFYTPHEVSLLMSEIVADHLKSNGIIKIYDPTSGSGSLLINIGRSVAKHIDDENNIKYYAQELKINTFNLTRMNLVMRGILPDNIVIRNGDTLEEDWPFFEENNPNDTYEPLYVDAVVSNPPYSQAWEPANKEADPRYSRFGLAPKTKADFAFLLHDLYHLKPNGIMTVVLPHGVLFRGDVDGKNGEGKIRKNLIEENHIDAIIGLPPNVFFGTGIATIVMVLKQKRQNNDVLFIDASRGFIKVGKNNQLRASDIKKIADTVINRADIPKYSRKVTREEIRNNDWNLNIPRYVDSADEPETWDLYASMFGGIPKSELEELREVWTAFPNLWAALFSEDATPYVSLIADDVKSAITNNSDVKHYLVNYAETFKDFEDYLHNRLIGNMENLNISREENIISEDIFARLNTIRLIDKYKAYQALNDEWVKTAVDIEIIQTEGFSAVKAVDPNMVFKKKGDIETEVQEGWVGRVIPFDLVQATLLKTQADALREKESRLTEITSTLEETIEAMTEEEKEEYKEAFNNDGDAFAVAGLNAVLKKRVYADIESAEIIALNGYWELLDKKAKKPEQEAFIMAHPEVCWSKMEAKKDGTYAKTAIGNYIKALQSSFAFPDDSIEGKLISASDLLVEQKELKAEVKKDAAALHLKTKETIEKLTDAEALMLLDLKWIKPIVSAMNELPQEIIRDLVAKVTLLAKKYAVTYVEVVEKINKAKSEVASLIDGLRGNDFDMKGLGELKALLGDRVRANDR